MPFRSGWLAEYNYGTDMDMEISWYKKLSQLRTSLHTKPLLHHLVQLPKEL